MRQLHAHAACLCPLIIGGKAAIRHTPGKEHHTSEVAAAGVAAIAVKQTVAMAINHTGAVGARNKVIYWNIAITSVATSSSNQHKRDADPRGGAQSCVNPPPRGRLNLRATWSFSPSPSPPRSLEPSPQRPGLPHSHSIQAQGRPTALLPFRPPPTLSAHWSLSSLLPFPLVTLFPFLSDHVIQVQAPHTPGPLPCNYTSFKPSQRQALPPPPKDRPNTTTRRNPFLSSLLPFAPHVEGRPYPKPHNTHLNPFRSVHPHVAVIYQFIQAFSPLVPRLQGRPYLPSPPMFDPTLPTPLSSQRIFVFSPNGPLQNTNLVFQFNPIASPPTAPTPQNPQLHSAHSPPNKILAPRPAHTPPNPTPPTRRPRHVLDPTPSTPQTPQHPSGSLLYPALSGTVQSSNLTVTAPTAAPSVSF